MGGALKGAGGILNSVASPLGLGGEQGQYAQANNSNPAAGALADRSGLYGDQGINTMLQNYANGSQSLNDVLNQEAGRVGDKSTAQQQAAFSNALATNAQTGSKYATDQVQNNDILGQLFGQGGQLNQAVSQANDLASRGYQLQPEDREAYGQASGDIARQFGQTEQNLSQSLADRGLASGPNGAAAVAFSGLQGNKNEQLAASQRAIADNRVQTNMARLAQAQNYVTNLGNQGAKAIQDQYGRQLSGAQNDQSSLEGAANAITHQNQAANQSNLASQQDERAAAGKTLFGAVGQNLYGKVSGQDFVSMMGGKQAPAPGTTQTSPDQFQSQDNGFKYKAAGPLMAGSTG